MKRVLLMVCSICLILACIFGLFACVAGMKDVLNIQAYKEQDAAEAHEGIDTARDGIKQLMENEDVYLDGVGTYEAGLIAYSQGKSQLNDGYAQYYAGKQALEEGKAAYAAGKKQIEENTQAYNEGKEKLAKIEPLLPYLNQYVEFRDGNLASLPGFSNAQVWFMTVVRPVAARMGLEIPDDVTDFPAYINQMVADGKAQLKQYEDGLAQLAAAEKTIAEGERKLKEAEAQLAQGEKDLAAGGAQLADGDAQLSVYEGGQAQLAAGMELLREEMVACVSRDGRQTVPSLNELLGEDFSLWVLNEDGSVKVERGCQFVDLENCALLCDKAEEYLTIQEADIKGELYPRIAMNLMMALAAVFGIIAGICGIVASISGRKKTGFVCGVITAVLAVAANIVGLLNHYTDFVYQTREVVDGVKEYTYSGDTQLYALIILAVVAVIFCIVAAAARKAARKAEAAPVVEAAAVEAAAAAAAAAPAADASRVADLEAENAALKQMVADLASDAATVAE